MERTINLWDYIAIHTETETEKIYDGFPALWELFGWDIERDKNAKECADIIVRELFCFGTIDLSPINHGKMLFLRVGRDGENTGTP